MINPKGKCPRCGEALVTDANTKVNFCNKCEFVITDKVEESGPELGSFSNEGEKSRARVPTSLAMHDRGLSTVNSAQNRYESGRLLAVTIKITIKRLRDLDRENQVHEPVDENSRQAFSELNRLQDKLVIGDPVIEKAFYIYRKAVEKGLLKGRSISTLTVSAFYVACREVETTITLKEICKTSNIKQKVIGKYYKVILRELNLKMPVADSVKCIARIAKKVELSEETKLTATKILQIAKKEKISAGKDPMILAAAALYAACLLNGEATTQRDIAESVKITESAIRSKYRKLKKLLDS